MNSACYPPGRQAVSRIIESVKFGVAGAPTAAANGEETIDADPFWTCCLASWGRGGGGGKGKTHELGTALPFRSSKPNRNPDLALDHRAGHRRIVWWPGIGPVHPRGASGQTNPTTRGENLAQLGCVWRVLVETCAQVQHTTGYLE